MKRRNNQILGTYTKGEKRAEEMERQWAKDKLTALAQRVCTIRRRQGNFAASEFLRKYEKSKSNPKSKAHMDKLRKRCRELWE